MSAARSHRGGPTLLGGLGLAVATIVAPWLVAEAVLRLFFDGASAPVRIAWREIGESYTPSRDGPLYDWETGRLVRVRFNALGFRGPDRPERKPAGVRRVAVLGDSMVAGLAVPEPDTTAGVLETLLDASGAGPRVEVMNFGVSASSPAQELMLYRGLVRRFAPDLVVLAYFSGNDLTDTSYEISDRYERIYLDLDAAGALRPRAYAETSGIVRALSQSRVFGWLLLLAKKARWTLQGAREPFPPTALGYLPEEDPRAERAWRLLEAVVADLAETVRTDGAELVVLMIPSPLEVSPRGPERLREWAGPVADVLDLDVQDRRLAALCSRVGVPYVSLKPGFVALAAADPDGDPLYVGRIGHLSRRGHRVAAEILAERLSSLLPVTGVGTP